MRIAILMFFTTISLSLFSQDPIKNLLLNTEDVSQYAGYKLLTIFDSTNVIVQETGLTHVVSHTLTKVLNSQGAIDQSVIKYGYDPQSAFVQIRKASIYKKSGDIIELDLNTVLDYPAPARAIYWGAREIILEVGRLEPGDAVEVILFRKGFTYALLGNHEDDRYIPPMRGHFYDIVDFFQSNPVKEKVYRVSVPKSKLIQYQFYNGECTASAWIEKENMVYTFSKHDMKPFKGEPRMVALSDVAPKLLISTSPDWYAKSKWFFGVNEDYGSFETTPEITGKVKEILRGALTESDSISRLTHWCGDEIRYSGISMGEGEGFTLHKGAMTFADRCGVCKDKAGMLITMLRAAGFKAYPAMTMAGSRIDYIPADQFNHCVTVVKLHNGTYQLLDPTWVPFVRELWSSAEQQQEYLMGLPEGADLATTPTSDPDNHFVKIDGVSELSAEGTLRGRITISAEGQSDASVRGLFKYSPQSTWFQNVERELLRVWPQAVVTQVKYSDPADYLGRNIWIAIDFQIPAFGIVSDNIMMFTPLGPAGIFKTYQGHLFFDTTLPERKNAFRDRCSRTVMINESVQLPPIKSVIRIPESVSVGGNAASFRGGYQLNNTVLTFSGTAKYEKRIYDAIDWPAFKTSVEAQNRFSEQPVIIEL
jgi:hypothetical protein